jgi:hypothetical protein
MTETIELTKVTDLKEGDYIDFEGDVYMDDGQFEIWEFEYFGVESWHLEPPFCIIEATGGQVVQLPIEYYVNVARHF